MQSFETYNYFPRSGKIRHCHPYQTPYYIPCPNRNYANERQHDDGWWDSSSERCKRQLCSSYGILKVIQALVLFVMAILAIYLMSSCVDESVDFLLPAFFFIIVDLIAAIIQLLSKQDRKTKMNSNCNLLFEIIMILFHFVFFVIMSWILLAPEPDNIIRSSVTAPPFQVALTTESLSVINFIENQVSFSIRPLLSSLEPNLTVPDIEASSPSVSRRIRPPTTPFVAQEHAVVGTSSTLCVSCLKKNYRLVNILFCKSSCHFF